MSMLIKAILKGGTHATLRIDDFYSKEFKSPLFSQFGSFEQLTWHDVEDFGNAIAYADASRSFRSLKKCERWSFNLSYCDAVGEPHFFTASSKNALDLTIKILNVDKDTRNIKVHFYGYEIPYFD